MYAVQKANEAVAAVAPKAPAASTLAAGFGISAGMYSHAGHALQLLVLKIYHRQLTVLGNQESGLCVFD